VDVDASHSTIKVCEKFGSVSTQMEFNTFFILLKDILCCFCPFELVLYKINEGCMRHPHPLINFPKKLQSSLNPLNHVTFFGVGQSTLA
jgi:hypothetical protein